MSSNLDALGHILSNPAAIDAEIARRKINSTERTLQDLRFDPYDYVIWAYPWGRPGTSLERFSGPDEIQTEFLKDFGAELKSRNFNGRDPVMPIRMAVTSGHGIGKSTLMGMAVNFILDTIPYSKGTITANTFDQLRTKTWASIQRWFKLNQHTANNWHVTGSGITHPQYGQEWGCTPQSSKAENSEAFAGQHAAAGSSFYGFDESSGIPDVIWDVTEGGLTDGMPIILAFGNATRRYGRFYQINWGDRAKRWNHRSVDSRRSAFSNKQLIAEWAEDEGEDSEFFRVRVAGLAPLSDDLSFIPGGLVLESKRRPTPEYLADEPLVAGLDAADGGSAKWIMRFRRGRDARSIPPIILKGSTDREVVISVVSEALNKTYPGGAKVAALFVDSAFGAVVADRLTRMGYKQVVEVKFGGESPDHRQANLRAFMWNKTKLWLEDGAIDDNEQLEVDLSAPGHKLDKKDSLLLESKESMLKRGVASPDHGDALALTFARPVAPAKPKPQTPRPASAWS